MYDLSDEKVNVIDGKIFHLLLSWELRHHFPKINGHISGSGQYQKNNQTSIPTLRTQISEKIIMKNQRYR